MSSPSQKKSTPVTLPSHSSTSTTSTIPSGVTPRSLPLHLTDSCVLKQRDLDDLSPKTGVGQGSPPGFRSYVSRLDDGDQAVIPESESLELEHMEEKGKSLSYTAKLHSTPLSNGSNSNASGTHYEQTMAEVKRETELKAEKERNAGLTTMQSAKKLTKNQSFRLKKFGTVMPVAGGEEISSGKSSGKIEIRSPDSTTSPDQELMRSISKAFPKKRVERSNTLVRVAKKVGNLKKVLGAMGLKKKKEEGEEEDNENKHKRAWEKLLDDHLNGAESQLRRYLRWQEDYRYFLKTHKTYDELLQLTSALNKRGTCLCPLSKQSCGPMDPYLYTVHCGRCKEELAPFADQMVCMVKAIGQPDSVVAHRNAIGLEMEEERDMLAMQEVFIEQLDEDKQNIAEGRSVLGARRHHHHHGVGSVHEGGGGRMSGGRASGGSPGKGRRMSG
ncbi:hypothetical protein TL16_g12655 [Triparma laevis f. inornata]|uniref:Uncharacterized protein n=2 Tax=Triparma laevis TaxID=1534972 RepID=A0A9W7F2I7_9STRA|nr:hypothetical protein TL16_g12655 [Triparma laevis f. inornata]GMH99740.1 hypothetical protein TrLO_g9584 [Triparma laevis f. longispina]